MLRLSSSRSLAGPLSLAFLSLLSLAAPDLAAEQFFVDSTSGSDSNSGATPAQALKTLRKALSLADQDFDMVVLAPGDYSQATGEAFPLSVGTARIVGAGAELTRILGSGNDILFDARNPDDPGGSMLVLDGLSLVGGRTGIRANSPAHLYVVSLSNLAIRGMSADGIEAHADATGGAEGATSLHLTNVEISDCLRSLSLESSSPTIASGVWTYFSRFERNTVGPALTTLEGHLEGQFFLSRFEDNEIAGVRGLSATDGGVNLYLWNCLVARNGVGVELGSFDGEAFLTIESCTITGSPHTGVLTDGMPDPPTWTGISGSIVWGNKDDVSLGGVVVAHHNDVGDGDLGSLDGNLSADPLFRDTAAGDYRLSWGSPAIDATGLDLSSQLSQDLVGTVRPTDGNVDGLPLADLGCLEFATLDLIGEPAPTLMVLLQPGDTLRLESWGPSGSTTLLLLSLGQFTGCPFPTKFGNFFLNPNAFFALATLASGPATPGVLQAVIPSVPSLVGLDFSFQGLTTSTLAPQGKSLTNPAQFGVRN